jgi:translation elongation factor EF-Tu-like GTPase
MSAEVEVQNSIVIPGMGAVVVGYVRAGTVRVGQMTEPLSLGEGALRRLEVESVQRLSSMESSGAGVGIVFRHPPHLELLRRALPPGCVLVLEEAGAAV